MNYLPRLYVYLKRVFYFLNNMLTFSYTNHYLTILQFDKVFMALIFPRDTENHESLNHLFYVWENSHENKLDLPAIHLKQFSVYLGTSGQDFRPLDKRSDESRKLYFNQSAFLRFPVSSLDSEDLELLLLFLESFVENVGIAKRRQRQCI